MALLINIILILFLPFLSAGTIKKTKAFWAGRKGVSLWQPLYDFIKLLKKDYIISSAVSWIFYLTPAINIATVLTATLLVPLAFGKPFITIPFSFIIFSYILGIGKFFSLLSALDTGSSFEGMGAAREACFSTIVEPAFFILMASISAITGIFSFESLKLIAEKSGPYGIIFILLAVLTLFIMLLIEGCRVPVDDPTTHLELTMIHEVMILDNSGPGLALITWASSIKMFLFEALIANLLIPASFTMWQSLVAFTAIIFVISFAVGTLESAIARFRMTHIFEFIFTMSVTALLVLGLAIYRIYGN